jgi:hypothetical protein
MFTEHTKSAFVNWLIQDEQHIGRRAPCDSEEATRIPLHDILIFDDEGWKSRANCDPRNVTG